MLTAGLILAIMVLPFITSISRDVFDAVPPVLKEAAYGLGCTTWEVVRYVVLPYTRVGVIGGVMLGLGRALGETMAVTFVIGNAHRISASILAPGTTISATIANEFTEAVGDLYTSSLIALGLILFVITFIVLAIARYMLLRLERRIGVHAMNSSLYAAPPAPQHHHDRPVAWPRPRSGSAGWCSILGALLWEGFSGLSLRVFTEMTPPPGRRRRPAQSDRRQPDHDGPRGADRHADRHPRRHLHGRIRPLRLADLVVRFINDILLSAPSIVIGLFIYEVMVAPMGHFSGLRRRGRAGRDRDAGRGAHHRGHAAPGARTRCARPPPRSGCRAR